MIRPALSPSAKGLAVAALVFLLVGGAIYSEVLLYADFVFDDVDYVLGNAFIMRLSNFLNFSEVRYVGYLSFALDYAAGGLNPRGYHVVNVAIHVANAVLVYLLVRCMVRLTRQEEGGTPEAQEPGIPFAVALLFLTHPLATQSVSYVSRRFSSLATFFYLSAVVLYLAGREARRQGARLFNYRLALALVCACLGMKTKEIVFTLPVTLTALEAVFFRGDAPARESRWWVLAPFYATAVLVPLSLYGPELGLFQTVTGVSEQVRGLKLLDLDTRSRSEYLATQVRVIVTYLRLLVAPYGQRILYDYPLSSSFLEARVAGSFLLLAAVAGGGWHWLRRSFRASEEDRVEKRLVGVGVLWFFVTLSVESSVIPIKHVIFEHRTYLPSVGAYLALAALAEAGMRRWACGRRGRAAVFLLLGAVLGALTYQRNRVWLDVEAFWNDAVLKEPGLPIVWLNRAWSHRVVERAMDLALRDIDRAVALGEERCRRTSGDANPADELMQLARAYEDRIKVERVLGRSRELEEDSLRLAVRLEELRQLTGLDYTSEVLEELVSK